MPNGTCTHDGCQGEVIARGWCESHYRKWKRTHPETISVRCTYDGCNEPHLAKGWCVLHYSRWKRTGDPGPPKSRFSKRTGQCLANGCPLADHVRGYCDTHYARVRRNGFADAAGDRRRRVGVEPCKFPGCPGLWHARGWCNVHYERWRRHGDPAGGRRNFDRTDAERFFQKVEFDFSSGCWPWQAQIVSGYGRFRFNGRQQPAHRWAYLKFVGPIPKGLVLDHLCRNRSCVNPAHLEAVTPAENVARGLRRKKTHCPAGHPYDEANTRIGPTGHRFCRACVRRHRRGDYTRWRAGVMARDGSECTECRSTTNLDAHHIVGWNESPELRFEVSNGVTLCRRCHMRLHQAQR